MLNVNLGNTNERTVGGVRWSLGTDAGIMSSQVNGPYNQYCWLAVIHYIDVSHLFYHVSDWKVSETLNSNPLLTKVMNQQ
jgi:hypothetical protein